MDLVQRLLTCGIRVELTGSDLASAKTCQVILPLYLLTEAKPRISPSQRPQTDSENISLSFTRNSTGWIFSLWDWAPGPDIHDFVATFTSTEALLTAVISYYTGGPTQLDGWLVPLHRHPELLVAQARFAIKNATLADPTMFDDIARKRQNRALGSNFLAKDRWVLALQYQFLPIPHSTDPDLILYMRRDAQEAFIVQIERR